MTLHLVNGHRHTWRQYVLKDDRGIYYKGYVCIGCKAAGYSIPKPSPETVAYLESLDIEHEEDRAEERHHGQLPG